MPYTSFADSLHRFRHSLYIVWNHRHDPDVFVNISRNPTPQIVERIRDKILECVKKGELEHKRAITNY